MRKIFALSAFLIAFTGLSFAASQPQIKGEYLETRSADVYVGQCFANSEMNLAGDEAIVAWHVTDGQ